MNNYETLKRIRDNIINRTSSLDSVFEDVRDLDAILNYMERIPQVFFIDDNLCLALQHYFLTDAGYVSHEFHPDVHKFMKELDNFIIRKGIIK